MEMHYMSIYCLKIALIAVTPQIWRRIEVDAATPLSKLRRILLDAMGWEHCHLHRFVVGDTVYGVKDPEEGGSPYDEWLDERNSTLRKISPHVKSSFMFEYDFGDRWKHRITVETIGKSVSGIIYPRCIAGKNACPPEDCGGPYGYAELLEIAADSSHPEHEERKEWLGDDFDPKAFDLNKVNIRLGCERRAES
jgi:hypothetical protein